MCVSNFLQADTIINSEELDFHRHELNQSKAISQSAKYVRNQNLDKFYTTKHTAKQCIDTIEKVFGWNTFELVIEPSAGSGNFLLQIPHSNKIGIDIEPEHIDIIKQDFFKFSPKYHEINKKILTIGNPPFGRVCSLAVKFFNHAASYSDTIAFIIPRSFRKTSIQNRLDLNFHLVHDNDLSTSPCCFIPKIKVKCCYQIWVRKNNKRIIINQKKEHPDWKFVSQKNIDIIDFAIRAYGSNCGTIITENFLDLNPKGWHFIKSNIDNNLLIKKIKSLDFSSSKNTARQDSIGKSELVELYKTQN